MSAKVDVAVIVVGINSLRYVKECLQSLSRSDWNGYTHQIVYVDNGSQDSSAEFVRAEFPAVTILANAKNEGFCKACNQGVELVRSRYVYLLNNDTVLFPDSVSLLVKFLDGRPQAAVAGNRLLNPDLSDQWSARRFPTWVNAVFGRRTLLGRLFPGSVRDYLYKDLLGMGEPFEVDWMPGSCTLVRRKAYEAVGGLPENMHYWSDAVFCDRLRRDGGEIWLVPGAKLIHHEGKGAGPESSAARRWLISDFHRGAYRFYCEHYGLGPWNPARWIAAVALGLRSRLLLFADSLSHARFLTSSAGKYEKG